MTRLERGSRGWQETCSRRPMDRAPPGSPSRRAHARAHARSSPSSSSSRWPSASAPTPRCSRSSTRYCSRRCPSRTPIASSTSTKWRSGSATAARSRRRISWTGAHRPRRSTSMSVYAERNMNVATAGGEPERLSGAATSTTFFDVLGAEPVLGRAFQRGDAEPGQPTSPFSATGCGSGALRAPPTWSVSRCASTASRTRSSA